jgi:hypothetical protein
MTTSIIEFTRSALLALAAACGTVSDPDGPDEVKPADQAEEDQHFCCVSVGVTQSGKPTGDGCVTIGAGNVDICSEVIYCSGDWLKSAGKVTCL